MMFFSEAIFAETLWSHCGVLMRVPKNVHINLVEEKSERCEAKIDFFIKNAPSILEDQRGFEVSREFIQDRMERTGVFKKISGEYKFLVALDVEESQYFLKTIKKEVISLDRNRVKGVWGVASIKVGINPSVLWPSLEIRSQAIGNFFLKGQGLIFDCFYGQAEIAGKPLSVALSGCLPRTRNSADLSVKKIREMLESLRAGPT